MQRMSQGGLMPMDADFLEQWRSFVFNSCHFLLVSVISNSALQDLLYFEKKGEEF